MAFDYPDDVLSGPSHGGGILFYALDQDEIACCQVAPSSEEVIQQVQTTLRPLHRTERVFGLDLNAKSILGSLLSDSDFKLHHFLFSGLLFKQIPRDYGWGWLEISQVRMLSQSLEQVNLQNLIKGPRSEAIREEIELFHPNTVDQRLAHAQKAFDQLKKFFSKTAETARAMIIVEGPSNPDMLLNIESNLSFSEPLLGAETILYSLPKGFLSLPTAEKFLIDFERAKEFRRMMKDDTVLRFKVPFDRAWQALSEILRREQYFSALLCHMPLPASFPPIGNVALLKKEKVQIVQKMLSEIQTAVVEKRFAELTLFAERCRQNDQGIEDVKKHFSELSNFYRKAASENHEILFIEHSYR